MKYNSIKKNLCSLAFLSTLVCGKAMAADVVVPSFSMAPNTPKVINGITFLLTSTADFQIQDSSKKMLWHSNTNYACGAGCSLSFQGDGNIVIYQSAGKPVWSSETPRRGPTRTISSDGKLVVKDGSSNVVWSSAPYTFLRNAAVPFRMGVGESRIFNNKKVLLTNTAEFQVSDYLSKKLLMSIGRKSSCTPLEKCAIVFQGDGNLVIYNSGAPWGTGTSEYRGYSLILGTENNEILIKNSAANIVWSKTPDTVAPVVAVSSAPAAILKVNSASISFSASDASSGVASLQCALDSGAFSACTSPKTFTNLTQGNHTIKIKAIDNAKNESTVSSAAFMVDTVLPAVAITGGPAATSTSTSGTVTFTASDAGSGVASIQCALDSAALSNCGSPLALTNLSVAAHTFKVQVTDRAGNTKLATTSFVVTPVTTPASGCAASSGIAKNFPCDLYFNQTVDQIALNATQKNYSDHLINGLVARGGWGNSNIMQADFSIDVLETQANHSSFFTVNPNDDWTDADPITKVPAPVAGSTAGFESSSGLACDDGDCHYLVLDKSSKSLFEFYRATASGGNLYNAGYGGAVVWPFDKKWTETLRGDVCTSADASGLSIGGMLFSAEEIKEGAINHAIRFILPNNRIAYRTYVRPATHTTGGTGWAPAPTTSLAEAPLANSALEPGIPYGTRLRLKASYDISKLSAGAQVVAKGLKKYGMILADGGNIALTAKSDKYSAVKYDSVGFSARSLAALKASDFEVVPPITPKVDTSAVSQPTVIGPMIKTKYLDCVRTN